MHRYSPAYIPAHDRLEAVAEAAARAWPAAEPMIARALSDVLLVPGRLCLKWTDIICHGIQATGFAPADTAWHIRPTPYTDPPHSNAWQLAAFANGDITCNCPSFHKKPAHITIDRVDHTSCKHTLALRIYRRALEDEIDEALAAGVKLPCHLTAHRYYRRGRHLIHLDWLHVAANWFDELHMEYAFTDDPYEELSDRDLYETETDFYLAAFANDHALQLGYR